MPKKYWHTHTLFKKWKKFYWSFKYNHCKKCGQVDNPHKWNWFCIKCWESYRRTNSPRRKITVKINQKKFWIRKRIKRILKTPERKPIWAEKIYWKATPEKTKQTKLKANRKYYNKNKEAIYLRSKANLRKKQGKVTQEIIINWICRYFPWDYFIEKPGSTTDPKYEDYRKQQKEYRILRKFYEKIKPKKESCKKLK